MYRSRIRNKWSNLRASLRMRLCMVQMLSKKMPFAKSTWIHIWYEKNMKKFVFLKQRLRNVSTKRIAENHIYAWCSYADLFECYCLQCTYIHRQHRLCFEPHHNVVIHSFIYFSFTFYVLLALHFWPHTHEFPHCNPWSFSSLFSLKELCFASKKISFYSYVCIIYTHVTPISSYSLDTKVFLR